MIKDKLPRELRKCIKQIRWENEKSSTTNGKVKLPEAKSLFELQELIKQAKDKYNYDQEDQQQQAPTIEHGFQMNVSQQRDRSRYPSPQYPRQGKPNFTPTTTPREYGKASRGGRRRGRGRSPKLNIAPTNVKQNTTVRFRDRPPYWHGVCTTCGIPGHHADSHDELQQFRATIAFYFRKFFREINQGAQNTNQRRINSMKQSTNDTNSTSQPTANTTQSTTTTPLENTFLHHDDNHAQEIV